MAKLNWLAACMKLQQVKLLFTKIKTRRFILTYLVLLPFSLIDEAQMMSPLIAALVAYPLLSLDRIGVELQNPFSKQSLSHLPLDAICEGIKANAVMLKH